MKLALSCKRHFRNKIDLAKLQWHSDSSRAQASTAVEVDIARTPSLALTAMVADPGMRLVQMGCLKARTVRSLWSCGSSSRKYGADLQCTCSVWINFFTYASISGGEHIYIGGALLTEAGRFEIPKVLSAQDTPSLNKVLAKLDLRLRRNTYFKCQQLYSISEIQYVLRRRKRRGLMESMREPHSGQACLVPEAFLSQGPCATKILFHAQSSSGFPCPQSNFLGVRPGGQTHDANFSIAENEPMPREPA